MYTASYSSDRSRGWKNILNITPVNVHKLHPNLKSNSINLWIIGTFIFLTSQHWKFQAFFQLWPLSTHWKNFKHYFFDSFLHISILFSTLGNFSQVKFHSNYFQCIWENDGKYSRLSSHRFGWKRSESGQADKTTLVSRASYLSWWPYRGGTLSDICEDG